MPYHSHTAIALAMAMAKAIAMAVAMATAMAMIRPEYAEGARNHENLLFIEKYTFCPILIISGPSRPQKWIWLKSLRWKIVLGGLET